MKFGAREMLDDISEKRLVGVHADLVRVVRQAFLLLPPGLSVRVNEGLRTRERQAQLVASGASKTMNSRHLTGHAVDLVALVDLDGDGKPEVRWDWPLYYRIAEIVRAAARAENVPVVWGGNWKPLAETPAPITAKSLSRTFPDGPHFELPRNQYP